MANITKPPLLDETGQAIATALGNISIRPQIVDNCTTADSTKALSAGQGKTLKDTINGLPHSSFVTLTANTDLNSCTDPTKIYYSSSTDTIATFSHRPTGGAYWGECMVTYLPFGYGNYGKQVYQGKAGAYCDTFERVNDNGTWSNWKVQGENKYYNFNQSFNAVYDDYSYNTITTNVPSGYYLVLVHCETTVSSSGSLLIMINNVTGGRAIFAPQFRGSCESGGGTAGWMLVEMSNDKNNSITFLAYGYFAGTYKQVYNVSLIRLNYA